jgi:hypothetical protein
MQAYPYTCTLKFNIYLVVVKYNLTDLLRLCLCTGFRAGARLVGKPTAVAINIRRNKQVCGAPGSRRIPTSVCEAPEESCKGLPADRERSSPAEREGALRRREKGAHRQREKGAHWQREKGAHRRRERSSPAETERSSPAERERRSPASQKNNLAGLGSSLIRTDTRLLSGRAIQYLIRKTKIGSGNTEEFASTRDQRAPLLAEPD